MRFAFVALVALALVACSKSPDSADAARADAACSPGMFLNRCMCGAEFTGSVSCLQSGYGTTGCVCPDASAPADASDDASTDAPSSADAATADVPLEAATDTPSAPDVTGDAPRCPSGITGTCGGRSVDFQTGLRQSDGSTLHCGRCGNTCAVGSFCEVCVCTR